MKKSTLLSIALIGGFAMSAFAFGNLQPAQNFTGQQQLKTVSFDQLRIDSKTLKISAVKGVKPMSAITKTPACYRRPGGTFYAGLMKDYSSVTIAMMLAPAYTPVTWTNTCGGTNQIYKWTYQDNDGNVVTSTDKNLVTKYKYGYFNTVALTASAPGMADSTYCWLCDDTTSVTLFGSSLGSGFTLNSEIGAGNYDAGKGFADLENSDGVPVFGYDPDTKKVWLGLMNDTTMTDLNVVSISNYFDKPVHPYVLTNVWVGCVAEVKSTVKYKLSIIRLDDKGYKQDTIASGTCLGSDFITIKQGTHEYINIPFTMKKVDPVTGLELEGPVEISDAVIMELTGFTDGKSEIGFFQTVKPNDNLENNAYITMDITRGGAVSRETYPATILETNYGKLASSFMFNTDATYTWLQTLDDQTDLNFTVPAAGAEQTWNMKAYAGSGIWTVAQTDGSVIPDWLSYSVKDSTKTVSGSNYYMGFSDLTLTADPLPSGVTGRSCDVAVSIPGSKAIFHVVQGDGSVKGVKVDNGVKAWIDGSDIIATYPAGVSGVKIYNVAGQLLRNGKLDGSGRSVIDAQNLAHGLYILKFNNGSNVKVLK
jgi:hypothetical protein